LPREFPLGPAKALPVAGIADHGSVADQLKIGIIDADYSISRLQYFHLPKSVRRGDRLVIPFFVEF
jgi:hypothetical protein